MQRRQPGLLCCKVWGADALPFLADARAKEGGKENEFRLLRARSENGGRLSRRIDRYALETNMYRGSRNGYLGHVSIERERKRSREPRLGWERHGEGCTCPRRRGKKIGYKTVTNWALSMDLKRDGAPFLTYYISRVNNKLCVWSELNDQITGKRGKNKTTSRFAVRFRWDNWLRSQKKRRKTKHARFVGYW